MLVILGPSLPILTIHSNLVPLSLYLSVAVSVYELIIRGAFLKTNSGASVPENNQLS